MFAGQLALVSASIFFGCALYMTFVEQSARLKLDDPALLNEWKPSDHRGFPLFAILSLIAAFLALAAYFSRNDFRWMLGALVIAMTWPYWYVVMVPMNTRLLAIAPGTEARQMIRTWGWMEAGLCVVGGGATVVFLWAILG